MFVHKGAREPGAGERKRAYLPRVPLNLSIARDTDGAEDDGGEGGGDQ